jgi:hypothetical protein
MVFLRRISSYSLHHVPSNLRKPVFIFFDRINTVHLTETNNTFTPVRRRRSS